MLIQTMRNITNHKDHRTIEEDLAILLENSQRSPSLSIKEILEIFSGKGSSLILIFLSLPFCQPIQIPGLSIPFGIVIAFIGLRIAFGKRIWLPKKLLFKTVPSKTIEKTVQTSVKVMKKIRRFIRPRLSWLCKYRTMHILNGLLIFLLGIFLALPIPLTNLLVGWSIFLVSLGFLEDDGVFVLIGYVTSLFTLLCFILIIFSIKNIF
jgi:hypothetical protein